MRIQNITRGTELARSVQEAENFFERLKGLIGKTNFNKGEALVFKRCPSVHTFGMRFSIDLLFVDKDLKVMALVENLKPYAFTPFFAHASLTIELPTGTLAESRTRVGDQIAVTQ